MRGFRFSDLSIFIFTIVLGFHSLSFANIKTYVAISSELQLPLLIFAKESENAEQAWQRYLKQLQQEPSLFELFQGRLPYLPDLKFQKLSEADLRNSAVLIANDPQDYTNKSKRLRNFQTHLNNAKDWQTESKILVLPVAADVGLTRAEAKELRELIRDQVPLLVAMGGADVDPSLYRQENSYSVNLSKRRDQFEIQLVQSYLLASNRINKALGAANSPKGFMLSICRGAQLTAVALGYPLIQDIPKLSSEQQNHQQTQHLVQVFKTENNLFADMTKTHEVSVNSYHHQAVQWRPNGVLEIAALSHDGIIEAMEHKNGRALLLQFHPEMMPKLGKKIFERSLELSLGKNIRSCSSVFN